MPKKTWKCFRTGTRAWNSSRFFRRVSSTHTSFNHRSTNKLIKDKASGVYWGASHYHTAGEQQWAGRKHSRVHRNLGSPDYLAQKKKHLTALLGYAQKKEKEKKIKINKRQFWYLAITSDFSHPSLVVFSLSTINTAPAAMQAGHKKGSSVMCQCDLESGYWGDFAIIFHTQACRKSQYPYPVSGTWTHMGPTASRMLFAVLGENWERPPETFTHWPDCQERGLVCWGPSSPGPCPYVVMWWGLRGRLGLLCPNWQWKIRSVLFVCLSVWPNAFLSGICSEI